MIAIYPSGTPVKLKLADFDGQILAAEIRGDQVSYLVAYFEGGAYVEKWLFEFQFVVQGEVSPRQVGFIR